MLFSVFPGRQTPYVWLLAFKPTSLLDCKKVEKDRGSLILISLRGLQDAGRHGWDPEKQNPQSIIVHHYWF